MWPTCKSKRNRSSGKCWNRLGSAKQVVKHILTTFLASILLCTRPKDFKRWQHPFSDDWKAADDQLAILWWNTLLEVNQELELGLLFGATGGGHNRAQTNVFVGDDY